MPVEIKTAVCGDIEMKYCTFGGGEKDFIILPGLSILSVMLSADAIAEAYASFGEKYKIWVFDRRENVPEKYSVADMAKDTALIMKELGISDAYIFGASQGGMMAQVIAIEYPELVNRLMLASSVSRVGSFESDYVWNNWMKLAESRKIHELNLDFCEKIYTPELFEQFKDAIVGMENAITEENIKKFLILAKGTEYFDVYDRLELIQCPVLILGSKKDAVLQVKNMEETAEALGCEIYLYDEYSHAVYDEAPDFKERLLEFCDR